MTDVPDDVIAWARWVARDFDHDRKWIVRRAAIALVELYDAQQSVEIPGAEAPTTKGPNP